MDASFAVRVADGSRISQIDFSQLNGQLRPAHLDTRLPRGLALRAVVREAMADRNLAGWWFASPSFSLRRLYLVRQVIETEMKRWTIRGHERHGGEPASWLSGGPQVNCRATGAGAEGHRLNLLLKTVGLRPVMWVIDEEGFSAGDRKKIGLVPASRVPQLNGRRVDAPCVSVEVRSVALAGRKRGRIDQLVSACMSPTERRPSSPTAAEMYGLQRAESVEIRDDCPSPVGKTAARVCARTKPGSAFHGFELAMRDAWADPPERRRSALSQVMIEYLLAVGIRLAQADYAGG